MKIAHAFEGSLLYEPVHDPGVSFEQLAEELYGLELEQKLMLGGYTETRQTNKPVYLHLHHPHLMPSPTYQNLVGRPFDSVYVQAGTNVDAFDRKLSSFSVVLKNRGESKYVEMGFIDDEDGPAYTLQQFDKPKAKTEAETLPLDDMAAKVILKDLLIQALTVPHDFDTNVTIESLLYSLIAQSQEVEIGRMSQRTIGDLETGLSSLEVNFSQKVITKGAPKEGPFRGTAANVRPERTTSLGVTSVVALTGNTEHKDVGFASTRLSFDANPKGILALIQVGIGNVSPQIYGLAQREKLIGNTYRHLRQPEVFTEKILAGLGRLCTPDISDFDFSDL